MIVTIISGVGGAIIGYFKYFWRLWYTGRLILLSTQYIYKNKILFELTDKTSFIR